MGCAGRLYGPHILADLTPHQKLRLFLTGKQKPCPKRNLLPIQHEIHDFFIARRKMPRLIKLPVIRNARLRNHPQNFSVPDCRRRIIQLLMPLNGQPHKDKRILPFRKRRNLPQRRQRFFQQNILPKQILTGIARNTEFRKQ